MLQIRPTDCGVTGAGVGMDGADNDLANIKLRTQLHQALPHCHHQIPVDADQIAGNQNGTVIATVHHHSRGHQRLFHILADPLCKLTCKRNLLVGGNVNLRPADFDIAHKNCSFRYIFLLV